MDYMYTVISILKIIKLKYIVVQIAEMLHHATGKILCALLAGDPCRDQLPANGF